MQKYVILNEELLNQFKINQNLLIDLCQKTSVKTLSFFGSILSDKFVPGQSDLDFLVEFHEVSFDNFFDLQIGLRRVFNYEKIDLVTISSLKNRIIREDILSTRKNIYAA